MAGRESESIEVVLARCFCTPSIENISAASMCLARDGLRKHLHDSMSRQKERHVSAVISTHIKKQCHDLRNQEWFSLYDQRNDCRPSSENFYESVDLSLYLQTENTENSYLPKSGKAPPQRSNTCTPSLTSSLPLSDDGIT